MRNTVARPVITTWSTDRLAPEDRWSCVVEVLGKALVPLNVSVKDQRRFNYRMSSVDLADGFTVLRQSGSPHRAYRGRLELASGGAHTFHFMVNLSSAWTIEHRDQINLKVGEGVLTDSNFAHDLDFPSSFEMAHIKMSETWMRRWLVNPADVVGQRISLDSGFGRALNLFAAQLSPQTAVNSPLHHELLANQFGSLLAMVASERKKSMSDSISSIGSIRDKVHACMQQRISERTLSVDEIAVELKVPSQLVHDSLAVYGQTFAGTLRKMRIEVSLRMLRSSSFQKFSPIEIAARAGFSDILELQRAIDSFISD